jgi:hypothetical protein
MVAVFDQLLGSNQSKTAGTSLVISPASKTVTVGKSIFVAFASDDVGSAFGIVDNLGNTYTQVGATAQTAGAIKSQLWRAPVTAGGSITSITISWTTNITAKAAVAAEYSNFGAFNRSENSTGSAASIVAPSSEASLAGELWIAAHGVEDNVAPTSGDAADIVAGSDGTGGGGSSSNISVSLVHSLISANGTDSITTLLDGTQNRAGVGAIYDAASAVEPEFPNWVRTAHVPGMKLGPSFGRSW